LNQKKTLKKEINNFLFEWHRFAIDYWWRKKYNIPFGSIQHREMNFIDMLIEYQEELSINKVISEENYNEEDEEDEALGLNDVNKKEIIKLSEDEIEDDYENLDLKQFNKEE